MGQSNNEKANKTLKIYSQEPKSSEEGPLLNGFISEP